MHIHIHIYVKNSIFLSFLKNENIISSLFLILFIFAVIVFFDTFIFRHRQRKIDNIEMVNQFMRQKKFIILPDDVLSRI